MSLIGIIDYGVGNVRSVCSAVDKVGSIPLLTSSPDELLACKRLILPGVGAFSHGMHELRSRGLDLLISKAVCEGIPILGVCLGMQLLAQKSFEFGECDGLGIVDGTVHKLRSDNSLQPPPLPHVAWKPLNRIRNGAEWLFDEVPNNARFYFIHSFAFSPDENCIVFSSRHANIEFGALLVNGNVIGTQFHPEKSGPNGLKLLQNFIQNYPD